MATGLLFFCLVSMVVVFIKEALKDDKECPQCGFRNEKDDYMIAHDTRGRSYYCNNCGRKY